MDFNPSNKSATAFRSLFGETLQSESGLYPSNRNYGQFSTGGNIHDTFRVDRYNNLYGGHTTIDLGGGLKKNLDW